MHALFFYGWLWFVKVACLRPFNLAFCLIFVPMKRYFSGLMLLLVVLLAGCGGCEHNEPYTGNPNPLWDLLKVSGRVKTLKTEYFEPMMKNGAMVPGSHVGDNITWDSLDASGNVVITKIFTLDGQLKKYETYVFNPKGLLFGIESFNGNGVNNTHQDIYYNSEDKKIKQVVTLKMPDGDKTYWRTWQYDDRGNINESYVYDVDSMLASRETLTYYEGDSAKIHVHTLYIGMDSLKYKNEYVYDSQKRDSILHRFRPNEAGDSVTYQSRYEYTYDEKGNELTRKLVNAAGVVRAESRFEYIFDDHNNWIQRFEYVDGEPNVVKVRTFTYYD